MARKSFTVLVEVVTTVHFLVHAEDQAAVEREFAAATPKAIGGTTGWASNETDGERIVRPETRLLSIDIKPSAVP